MNVPEVVTTADGLALPLRRWRRDGARGHVLVVHRLGEHSGRYEALARELGAAGFAVSSWDQRGHGRTAGAFPSCGAPSGGFSARAPSPPRQRTCR